MPWDIAILHKIGDLPFFNNRTDAVWTNYTNNYHRHYSVNQTLFDAFQADAVRIYSFEYPNSIKTNILGQNFLKRFNVFFDLRNNQVGFQPINNFKRVINPNATRFHYSTYQSPEGKTIIKYVADYKNNYYKTAGLRAGDEIIKVNGKNYNEYSWRDIHEFYKLEKIIFDVLRDGNPLKIEVLVDKNEKQGD